ncbi:MAG: hypothetical protein KY464_08095 [Gemmatimonadetes bacterium]|nr:hypothetical protein [Gemmatimonadota bacterium]
MATQPNNGRAFRRPLTEDALSFNPAVPGLPIAHPWRRGAAMVIDGSIAALLTNATVALFGFVAAFVLLRMSYRPEAGGGHLRA